MAQRFGLQSRLSERHAQQAGLHRALGAAWLTAPALVGVHRQRHLLFAVLGAQGQALRAGRCRRGQLGIGRADDLAVGNALRQAAEGHHHLVRRNRLGIGLGGAALAVVVQVQQVAAVLPLVCIALHHGIEHRAVYLRRGLCGQRKRPVPYAASLQAGAARLPCG